MAARGFWMELQYLCHQGNPYGHVASNGKPLSIEQIATSALCRINHASKWILELEVAGVFSRTTDGMIYCRRMLKDVEKTKKFSEFGKRGGNPTLKWGDNPRGPRGLTPGLSSIDQSTYSKSESARDATRPSNGLAPRSEAEEPRNSRGNPETEAIIVHLETKTSRPAQPTLKPAYLTPEQLAIVRNKRREQG
jgi:hypothetical protein